MRYFVLLLALCFALSPLEAKTTPVHASMHQVKAKKNPSKGRKPQKPQKPKKQSKHRAN